MENDEILIGILGLQVTIIAGLMEIADAIGASGEIFWFILALIGITITISAIVQSTLSDTTT